MLHGRDDEPTLLPQSEQRQQYLINFSSRLSVMFWGGLANLLLGFSVSCDNVTMSAGRSGNVESFTPYVSTVCSDSFELSGKFCFLNGITAIPICFLQSQRRLCVVAGRQKYPMCSSLYYPIATAFVLRGWLEKCILYCGLYYPVSMASLLRGCLEKCVVCCGLSYLVSPASLLHAWVVGRTVSPSLVRAYSSEPLCSSWKLWTRDFLDTGVSVPTVASNASAAGRFIISIVQRGGAFECWGGWLEKYAVYFGLGYPVSPVSLLHGRLKKGAACVWSGLSCIPGV